MGKARKGILDGFIGKVGTVVGSFWKGIKVMRSYNDFPSNPKTSAQQLQRAKFALLGKVGGALNEVLCIGLHNDATKHVSTPVGEFMDLNLPHVTGTAENPAIDWESLSISDGSLTPVGMGELDLSSAGKVKCAIESPNTSKFNSEHDAVYLVAINTVRNEAAMNDDGAKRNTSEDIVIECPSYWTGEQVQVYAFVKAAPGAKDPTRTSPTIYVGHGAVA